MLVLLLLSSLVTQSLSGQAARIVLDGTFEDWAPLTPIHTDASGDAVGGADFGRLWLSNDAQFLFLRVEVGDESLIQEFNEVTLFLDTDDNPSTGRRTHGIGAELSWTFGQRQGTYTINGRSVDIQHSAIGIVTAPTVTSSVFEIAIDRHALPDDVHALFTGNRLRVVLEDGASGDLLPDASQTGVPYVFDDATPIPDPAPIPLGREQADDLRLLSYNVQFDALFDPSRRPAFERILRAVSPDIIGFQEIFSHSAAETTDVVAATLPLSSGEQWFADRIADLVVVARFPIRARFPIDGTGNGAFLLDLRATWGTDLLLINAHPPCCRADNPRQLEIDAMMAFLRDAQTLGGLLELEPETPIVILGDMNLVGFAQQLTTLLEGDIVNTGFYGQPFMPDWDGSPLADLIPRHTALPMTFTWYNENSSFHPGRLDFMIYTDSVLDPGNRYVLFTPAMSTDSLMQHGLEPGDAVLASDHLPLIGDFRYIPSTNVASEGIDVVPPRTARLMQNAPNPVRHTTTISYELAQQASVSLVLFDVLGRVVQHLPIGMKQPGMYTTTIDATRLPSGVYSYRIEAGDFRDSKRMVVVR